MRQYLYGVDEKGRAVQGYELSNEEITVRFIDYGARLTDFIVRPLARNIVLGFPSLEGYLHDGASLGATVGRVANRIADACFTINGKTYSFPPNDGTHLLHSGAAGLGTALWHQGELPAEFSTAMDGADDSVCLTVTMPGEVDGFPGDAEVYMMAGLYGKELRLTYYYRTTEDSVVNITNHSYFNLNGTGDILDHEVRLYATHYAPFGRPQIPDGSIVTVKGSPFDFTAWQRMGRQLHRYKEALALYRGYDHHYVTQSPAMDMPCVMPDGTEQGIVDDKILLIHENDEVKGSEEATHMLCGSFRTCDIMLTISSDAPGFQLYTGNWLDDAAGREAYGPYAGMCIEPQFIPNDVNLPAFRQSLTKKGRWYKRTIAYTVDTSMTE